MVKFNKDKSLKLLAILEHAVFTGVTDKEDNYLLHEYLEELLWEVADKYKIDMNVKYIDIKTLEVKDFE